MYTDHQWRSLLTYFEDLTLEHAASPWDSRLSCRCFVADKMSLDLLTPTVRRLGMNETCEAMANHDLKITTLATSLAKVYAAHDAGRERLESDVARLKLLLDKTQTDLATERRAKEVAEEGHTEAEKRLSELNITNKRLQDELYAVCASLEKKLNEQNNELVEAMSRHHGEIGHLQVLLAQANENIHSLT